MRQMRGLRTRKLYSCLTSTALAKAARKDQEPVHRTLWYLTVNGSVSLSAQKQKLRVSTRKSLGMEIEAIAVRHEYH